MVVVPLGLASGRLAQFCRCRNIEHRRESVAHAVVCQTVPFYGKDFLVMPLLFILKSPQAKGKPVMEAM
jgi:hypothetical protein